MGITYRGSCIMGLIGFAAIGLGYSIGIPEPFFVGIVLIISSLAAILGLFIVPRTINTDTDICDSEENED